MFKSLENTLLLVARIVVGGIFIYAGWLKVSDMPSTLAMFSGLNIPAFLTYIVSYAEFIGGALLVLGFFTEFAAIVLSIIMLVAAYLSREGGPTAYMLPVAVFAALLQFMRGPGHYSLGCLIFGKKTP